eukprot:CAMPEP_0180186808 /NCGR_PEP_ID=MMETSP0986-20121125/43189_1 /TAXON_ID=697907 /ORGANISM="non described non described, Strain CCMP2293" /LENGTH=250 /DNA_ID=CAMNT_0022140853 /DNA_START=80 /DNA_END=833 /DNA_ORIENTATION=-
MRAILALALALAMAAHVSADRVESIRVVENPHMAARRSTEQPVEEGTCTADTACPALGFLDPSMVLQDLVAVQADTHLLTLSRKYQGLTVPIYQFKQPGRLNPDQLPFRLVRTQLVVGAGLHEVAVDPVSSHDSWFPAYSWTILMCKSCDGWRHLGWRFTPKASDTGGVGLVPFDALIVEYSEAARRWGREAGASREAALEDLTVGVRAPSWMIVLATATLGYQMNSPKERAQEPDQLAHATMGYHMKGN